MRHPAHLAFLAAAVLGAALHAQNPLPPPAEVLKSDLDSGYLNNPSAQAQVVFRKTVAYGATSWLQFRFDAGSNLPTGSTLRLTARLDGAVQRHDGATLAEWFHHSAAFNGGEVLVELVAGPRTVGNRIAIDEVQRGLAVMGPESICGNADNRALSSDPRQGRLFIGCTGWMIGQDLMLTAGHCVASGTPVIEFNVPLSTAGGSIVRAHPDDQYPFTILQSLNAGVGSDWGVNRVGRNSNHGQLPTQRNGGVWYSLGGVPASPGGQNIRITGYGSTSSPVSPTWYLVQKTHVGSLSQVNATSLCYATDTTGGNSGSPIIHENTGNAIGIHTHGGCTSSGGCNSGTRIDRSDLQQAIAAANPNSASFSTYGLGCPSPITFYELFGGGQSDLGGRSFRMTPAAGGGWSVADCTSNCFDPNFSNNLNLSDDQLATNLGLGFSFPLPGTGATTRIDVDSNGWIGLVAGQFTRSDFSESVSEFLTEGARLALLWDDLNPSNGGGVYFDTFPGKAMVTWAGVPQFGANDAHTFQAQFLANGEIVISYAAANASIDALVGFTVGGGVSDPGPIDLTASVPFSTGSGGQPVGLGAGSNPVLGTTVALRLSNLPASAVAAFLNLGLAPVSVDLSTIGMDGCSLLVGVIEGLPMTVGAGTATVSLGIPNSAGLLGVHVFAQGVVLAPGVNALGALTSNGGDLRLGS
jgi:V8-like Glu-specific endopeptidase